MEEIGSGNPVVIRGAEIMRTEQEMYDLIIGTAQEDGRIKAVCLTKTVSCPKCPARPTRPAA